jgi:hypothetical protein
LFSGNFVGAAAAGIGAVITGIFGASEQRKRLNVDLIDGEKFLELLEFSNLRKPPKLPDLVDFDAQWTGDDGMRVDTRKLLFGDLSRLFAN